MVTKSIWKAIRDVAITAGSVGLIAIGTFFFDPTSLQPIIDVLPDAWGAILVMVVPIAMKALVDWLKHRGR